MTTKDISQKSAFTHQAALAVFSLTLFLSASLMFALQPMAGKMLLPMVGGTPAGWIVAMAFFQIMLLVGYLAAHLLAKMSPRLHAASYIALLCSGLAFMPVALSQYAGKLSATPGANDIFMLLAFAVAVPFVAISATSSTIQRLFTTTGHKSSSDPYFLYVASNIGSFSGLLLYPLIIEPSLSLSAQSHYFTWFYSALIFLGLICLFLAGSEPAPQTAAKSTATTPARTYDYLRWMVLSFVPSSLLLGVTYYITTDIMSVPMMWVLPLSLYLLTFILAFSRKNLVPLSLIQALHPWGVLLAIAAAGIYKLKWLTSWNGVFFYLAVFFIVTLSCHLRLASLRPLDENRKHLTGFYLMMSVGGALGGIFNAFIVPNFAVHTTELPLMLVFSLLLHPAIKIKSPAGLFILACSLASFMMLRYTPPQMLVPPEALPNLTILALLALAVIVFVLQKFIDVFKLPSLMAFTAALFILSQFMLNAADILHSSRNFYGTIRVFEKEDLIKKSADDKDGKVFKTRYITHGTTIHGIQILEPAEYRTSTTQYFSSRGPLGEIVNTIKPKQVAVVGLGAGVINCLNAPDRHFTYIEIDPDMVKAAEKYFTFMQECKSAAPPKIIVGDGRLELARMENAKFDMIIIDAFSSDSIPTHLLTKEALDDYLSRLTPDGAIVFHISNRFFYLEKLLSKLADNAELQNRFKLSTLNDKPFAAPSRWMILAQKGSDLSYFKKEIGWLNLAPIADIYWTDDYSNLMSVARLTPPDITTYKLKGE
ncbi:MAG TPA: fused MFS/spermidine synthase [Alphaproteobacteria bacterium]|nr:fused MFS/spermidine synthase [Alphaproteobacteria bacterium]